MATPKKRVDNPQKPRSKRILPLSLGEEKALLRALGGLLGEVQPSVGRPALDTLEARVDAKIQSLLDKSFEDWYAENGNKAE